MNPWQSPPEHPCLNPGEVHVWQASLAVSQPRLESLRRLLSQDEQERADRFHFERNRRRFLAARGALRLLLSRYVNKTPEAVAFDYGRYGKPSLHPQPAGGLCFNLSHAHELALYAVSRDHEVGVDLEYLTSDRDAQLLVERFFSEKEKQEFRHLPENMRLRAFFSGWTRKEAFIKARGEGISFPLEKFSVSLHPDRPAELIQIDSDKQDGRSWLIRQIPIMDPEYLAAVAVSPAGAHFQYWDGSALLIAS